MLVRIFYATIIIILCVKYATFLHTGSSLMFTVVPFGVSFPQ